LPTSQAGDNKPTAVSQYDHRGEADDAIKQKDYPPISVWHAADRLGDQDDENGRRQRNQQVAYQEPENEAFTLPAKTRLLSAHKAQEAAVAKKRFRLRLRLVISVISVYTENTAT
jgi:hypothetical protein